MSESNYQYMLDLDGLGGVPDPSWTEADHHDGGSPLGLHFSTLFDQKSAEDGSLIDDSTGQPHQTKASGDVSAGLRLLDNHIVGEPYELDSYEDLLERELDIVEESIRRVDRERRGAFDPTRSESDETAA